jgi:hypothetical protein
MAQKAANHREKSAKIRILEKRRYRIRSSNLHRQGQNLAAQPLVCQLMTCLSDLMISFSKQITKYF